MEKAREQLEVATELYERISGGTTEAEDEDSEDEGEDEEVKEGQEGEESSNRDSRV